MEVTKASEVVNKLVRITAKGNEREGWVGEVTAYRSKPKDVGISEVLVCLLMDPEGNDIRKVGISTPSLWFEVTAVELATDVEIEDVLDPAPRRFWLNRKVDFSGVSGTGLVAHGVLWPDGSVVVRWVGKFATTTVHDSLESVEMIHLHGGMTELIWLDDKHGVDVRVKDLEDQHHDEAMERAEYADRD